MSSSDRYWDTVVFLGWLAKEPDKFERCRGVIRAAEAGTLRIVTSSYTLVEVIKLKSGQPLPPEAEPQISAFFEQPYIVVRQLDRKIAEFARSLIWKRGVAQKDSVHLATALLAKLKHFDTFDNGLIKLSGQLGDPPMTIGYPDLPEQLTLDDVAAQGSS